MADARRQAARFARRRALRPFLVAALVAGCGPPPPPPCPNGPDPGCSADGTTLTTCQGGRILATACGDGMVCERAACRPVVCKAALAFCDGAVLDTCSALGSDEARTDCAATGAVCVNDAAGARCVELACTPNALDCSADGKRVLKCRPDGLAEDLYETCDDPQLRGNACVNGVCADRCALLAGMPRTNAGCDFVGAPIAPGQAPTIAVLNLEPDLPATVRVTDPSGRFVKSVIAPNGWGAIDWPDAPLPDGTCRGPWGLSISSTVPVMAWQLGGPSADGSLLLPTASLGTRHFVPSDGTNGEERVALVGTQAGTQVTVTPKTATQAGGGIPSLPAGMPSQITVGDGDVVVLAASAPPFSGTRVDATAPIAVFAVRKQQLPAQAAVLPWTLLGKRYLCPGDCVVVAREGGTTANGVPLDAGDSHVFKGPVEVIADRPVAAAIGTGGTMFALAPTEQWLADPIALAPGSFSDVAVAAAADFTLDGQLVHASAVGSSFVRDGVGMGVVRMAGAAGALYVYGGAGVGLTGAMRLEPINP